MAVIVLVDANEGSLTRFEIGGESYRKTHAATCNGSCDFTRKVVEDFRTMPPNEFAVDPPPRPTNSPASAGIARAA